MRDPRVVDHGLASRRSPPSADIACCARAERNARRVFVYRLALQARRLWASRWRADLETRRRLEDIGYVAPS